MPGLRPLPKFTPRRRRTLVFLLSRHRPRCPPRRLSLLDAQLARRLVPIDSNTSTTLTTTTRTLTNDDGSSGAARDQRGADPNPLESGAGRQRYTGEVRRLIIISAVARADETVQRGEGRERAPRPHPRALPARPRPVRDNGGYRGGPCTFTVLDI